MKRPEGSNADEWQLFLKYWLDDRLDQDVIPFLAVQIAEAIDDQFKRNEEHHQAAMTMSEKHRKNWVEAAQELARIKTKPITIFTGPPE